MSCIKQLAKSESHPLHFSALMRKWLNMNNSLSPLQWCREKWKSTQCTGSSHTPLSKTWLNAEGFRATTEKLCISFSVMHTNHLQTHIIRFVKTEQTLLTHCISIALFWLCPWSFLLIHSLCTGWGAPHVLIQELRCSHRHTLKKKKLGTYWGAKTSPSGALF